MFFLPVYVLVIICLSVCTQACSQNGYTAAVYEHNRQDHGMTDARAAIQANLDYYKRASKIAKEQGADIILFPEYGIFSAHKRSEQKDYLEFIPNPKQIRVTPCAEPELFANRTIMYTLSCMAKANEMVVVANMGGIEHCANEEGCNEDGDRHLNANVAFDENGTLIARYYKERLYFEVGVDLPKQKQDPVFRTKFGTFAMFSGFDIIFEKMAVISQCKYIDAILFSAFWMNTSPFYISTQWFQAFAIGNNATVLAANIQMPGWLATGSGIFMGEKGSIGDILNPDGVSKLVVAKIPKSRRNFTPKFNVTAIFSKGSHDWKEVPNGLDVPKVCSYRLLGPAKDIYKDYRCYNEELANYTLERLHKSEDHLEVCNNGMCCVLDYSTSGMNDSYYLGVYNGTNIPFHRYPWWEENCFVARCDDVNGTECSTFPMMSDTFFYRMSLAANFTSRTTYPSFVGEKAKLIPRKDWTFNKKADLSSIELKSSSGIQILAASIKGRAYDKDPPYIR